MEISDTNDKNVDQFDVTEEDRSTLEPQISVSTGIASLKTMRVTGYYKKKPLHVLIDSGNIHNFLD